MKLPVIWLTQKRLLSLSGFALPAKHRSEPDAWKGLRRGFVEPVTVAQLRQMDRWGLFDEPVGAVMPRTAGALPVMRWRRIETRAGSPRVYSPLDVAVVRLASWMRRQGCTPEQVRAVLRGRWGLRLVLARNARPLAEPDAELLVSLADGAIHTTAEIDAHIAAGVFGGPAVERFPLAWLGMYADVLPRIQREQETTVRRWRQDVSIELVAREQRPPLSRLVN